MRSLVVVVLLAAGCYSPSVGDCEYTCSANGGCPSGLMCHDNACRVEGATEACDVVRDGGGNDDAGSDAPDALGPRMLFGDEKLQQGLLGYSQPSLTADEKQLWVVSGTQILHLDYSSVDHQFENPTVVSHVNGGAATTTSTPSVNSDSTVIYFAQSSASDFNVFHSTRDSAGFDFSLQTADPLLDTNADERPGTTNKDATRMILTLGSGDASDLYESSFALNMWMMPTKVDGLNSAKEDSHPTLSADGLTVVYATNRGGNRDLVIARRPTLDAGFEPPALIDELNTVDEEGDPWLSPNGQVIYFTRGTGSDTRLVRAQASP